MIRVYGSPSHWQEGKNRGNCLKMTRCRPTQQKYVRNSQHLRGWGVTRLLSFLFLSLYVVYRISSLISDLSSPVSYLPYVIPLVPSFPFSPWNTWAGGRGKVDSQQRWRMTTGWGGARLTASRCGGWPLGGRGQVDFQQGWRMNTGRLGVRMTASRRGREWPALSLSCCRLG